MTDTTLETLMRFRGQKFVEASFFALLGREVDASGLEHYMTRLRKGVDRLDILRELAFSREARIYDAKIAGLSKALRKRRWIRFPVIGSVKCLLTYGCSKRAFINVNMLAEQIEALSSSLEQGMHKENWRARSFSKNEVMPSEAASFDTFNLRVLPRRSLSVLRAISE